MVVTTARECAWSASATAQWILLNRPEEGQGEGRVTYTVARNDQQHERSGIIDINGVRVSLSQAAAPPPPPPPPPPPAPAPTPTPAPAPAPTPAPTPTPAPAPAPAPNPPPAPAPTPTPPAPTPAPPSPPPPAPTPPPPPEPDASGKPVEIEGTIASLSGACPVRDMNVAGTRVLTNSQTEFKGKLACADLRNGMTVKAKGPRRSDGAIVATKLELD